jgi:hypothetical protein
MKTRHKDLEFHIDNAVFRTFAEAAHAAINNSIPYGRDVTIDVVVWSRAAARVWAGDHGVEEYDADPDASVHERIIIKATSQGRVA